jgi:hypothetical protein
LRSCGQICSGAQLGLTDAWYGHCDAVGGTTFLRQFGTPAQDWAVGGAIDSAGGLRVSGYTSGSLFGANLGFADAFVARFDACDFFAWSAYCPANANSTGAPAQLLGAGSVRLSDNDFKLIASGCPAQQNGIFLISDTSTSQPFGDGVLCVGGSLLRFRRCSRRAPAARPRLRSTSPIRARRLRRSRPARPGISSSGIATRRRRVRASTCPAP